MDNRASRQVSRTALRAQISRFAMTTSSLTRDSTSRPAFDRARLLLLLMNLIRIKTLERRMNRLPSWLLTCIAALALSTPLALAQDERGGEGGRRCRLKARMEGG